MKLILLFVLFTTPALGQMVHKCPGPDGKLVYQQAPCTPTGGGEVLNIATPKMSQARRLELKLNGNPVNVQEATPKEIETCLTFLKIVSKYKDPSSVKTEGDTLISKYSNGYSALFLNVNAKNSYGAYAGSKLHTCIFDEKGEIDEVF